MKRRMLLATLAASGINSFVAYAQDKPILVGAAIPFSGANATYGEDVKLGVDLGLQSINAKGVLARQMKVEYQDTLSDRAKAAALFQQFAAQPDVVAILSYSTDEFVAVDPLATQLKVVNISVGSAGAIDKFSPYSFRVMTIVNKVMDAVIKKLQELKGIKSLAIIYETTNNYTVGESQAIKRAAAKYGIKVTTVETFTRGDQNFTPQLTQIAQTEPDMLVVSAATNEAVPIIVQARSIGIKGIIFGGTSLNDPHIGELAGKAALGMITYFPFDAKDQRPVVTEFIRLFHDKTGKAEPSAHTAASYDAIRLLADAIRRAGSTDRDAIRNALGSTKDFEGVNGSFSYSGSGDNEAQAFHLFAWGPHGYDRIDR
jgi:branched-chain amino acid transport system substrate-binding protein